MGGKETRLVGREAELGKLRDVLSDAGSGRLRLASIEGEAGIGKSRLVAEALPIAESLGFEYFVGRCSELSGARMFGPLLDAFGIGRGSPDPDRAAIAAMVTEHRDADVSVIEAICDLIEVTALRQPLLLVVEDIHWSDEATIAAIDAFGRRLRFVPLAVLCTRRRAPQMRAFDRLIFALSRIDAATEVHVPPLGQEAVAELAHALHGSPPPSSLLETLKGAGGNPLFVGELLAVAGEESTAAGTRPIPRMLALFQRLSILSEDALRTVRIAAILGSRFDPTELAIIAAVPLPALLPMLDECLHARVLEPADGDHLRFRHDLIREALYEDLPEAMRTSMHLEAARALEATRAPLERVAEHYALGARAGDGTAVDTLRRAARAAVGGQQRIRFLTRALDLLPPDDPQRDETEVELAEAHVWGGRSDVGEALARELLDRCWDLPLGRRMRSALLSAMRFQSRWIELIDLADAWQQRADLVEAERASIVAALALAHAYAFGDRSTTGIELGERALAIGERLGDDRVRFEAFYALSAAYGRHADRREIDAAERALKLSARNPQLARDRPLLAVAMALIGAGREEDARRAFLDERRRGDESGRAWDQHMNRALLARLHLHLGEWDRAQAEAEAAIDAWHESGAAMGLVTARLVLAHCLLWRKDDLAGAEAELNAADAFIAEHGPQWGDPGGLRWVIAWARGDLKAALDAGSANLDEAGHIPRLAVPVDLVLIAMRLGDRKRAAAIAEKVEVEISARAAGGGSQLPQIEEGSDDHMARRMRSVGAMCRAIIDGDADALARLVRAHEGSLMVGGGPGAWLYARAGRAAEAKRWLKDTLAALEADQNRLRARLTLEALRQEGVTIRRTAAKRPLTGWEALTDTERDVAMLAAEGLTNPKIGERLFISRRTVQAHLGHVFAKLGFTSRVELAAEVARRAANE